MEKQLFYLVLIFAILPAVSAEVLITEVMYDPITTESDTEFVELYNTGDSSVDIGWWRLNTTSIQATIPQGELIAPLSYYLIADGDDSEAWPADWSQPDLLDEITLTNTNSGLQLIDNLGNIVDVVGWGNPAAGLYWGTPATPVPEGDSLARRSIDGSFSSTKDNSADFLAALPTPKNSHSSDEPSQEIIVHAQIQGNSPLIDYFDILQDDGAEEGIQILPLPGKTRNISLSAVLTDSDGIEDIQSVWAELGGNRFSFTRQQSLNSTSSTYLAALPLEFYSAPGIYQLRIYARDSSNLTSTKNLSFEYIGIVAFEVDTDELFFDSRSGQQADIIGDTDMLTMGSPTIRNIGNTELDFRLSGTDLSSGSSSIPVSSLLYTFLDDDFNCQLSGTLTLSPILKETALPAGQSSLQEFSLRLDAPIGTKAGDYQGTIYLTGVMS